ncbi:Suv3 [Trypanosoma melophagium]|uniref:Suv3 n=1 Tax=Trypanosoma melophagium TaxID=715481 RepID=UPI00351AA2CE|nr:Suv3 [Trypanosoma melophagium]
MRRVLAVVSAPLLYRRTCSSCSETEIMKKVCEKIYSSSSAREQLRQTIHEASVENALRYLGEFCKDTSSTLNNNSSWCTKLVDISDDLGRIAVVLQHFEDWYVKRKAPEKVTMHEPWNWYPKARYMRRRFIFHYGPTNSGKTHAALEALINARSGVYCAPLKALAAQVWKRINEKVPCDLLIGDERKFGGGAEHVSCTVEMTPIDYQIDVGIIDEVQMISDRDRGWAWTRALLGLPAREIHLCGEERALALIRNLLYRTHELRGLTPMEHKRLVPLEVSPSLGGNLRSLENGDCIVCFSRKSIFDMKSKLEKLPGFIPHCIYGSMPFAVREGQATAFNNGVQKTIQEKVTTKHILISTDAIAYGLNMNIERIVFATVKKFDGKQMVTLPQATAVQVAGRAGRFGLTRSKTVGRCTTLYLEDFSVLHNAMSSRLPPLQKAGLLPTADILELYIRLHTRDEEIKDLNSNDVSFYEKIKDFARRCQDSDIFFPCDLSRSLLQIAKELETVRGLTLSDRILFCYVPLNDRSKESFDLLRAFAQDHAKGQPVRLRIDEEFQVLIKQCKTLHEHWCSREAQQILTRMEYIYRQAEVYCWLAWRFGKTFIHLEAGASLKERAAGKMDEILQTL